MTMNMPLNRRRLVAALAMAAAPAWAQTTVPLKHASGTTTVPANPKKVIVLDITTLDNLVALDVNVAGAPTASASNKPLAGRLARYSRAQNGHAVRTGF